MSKLMHLQYIVETMEIGQNWLVFMYFIIGLKTFYLLLPPW